ncbi:MAG: GDSL-type esterase/lipase family protein [Salinivirgaceae bacterium]
MNTLKIITILVFVGCFSCTDANEASSEKQILSFLVEGQVQETKINTEESTVQVWIDSTISLTAVAPEIRVSEKAQIYPASGQVVDFSKGPVDYTVTAEDNSTEIWKATIEYQKSNAAEILSFYLKRQNKPAVISDSTVVIEVKLGTDLTSLAPEIQISPKAVIIPESGKTVDFSQGPVSYLVTAENGIQKNWKVSVTTEKIYEADIISYTIPDQSGPSVFNYATITIEVPADYNLTSVVPEIVISDEATIEPASGVAVDFSETGYVDYLVTTPINSVKNWRVYVIEEVIKPTDQNIQYLGRVDFTNPLAPRFYAAGTGFILKFSGTYCQVLLNDQVRYGSYHNYIQVVIDGVPTRIQTSDKKNTIDLAKDLPEGEHTLMIFKDTEAGIGYMELAGLRCDKLLVPDPLPERRIEFIGNSITCGYGADESQIACNAAEWYDQHNAYRSYGPEVARRLNAQWMLTSVSGIGMTHSCCDITYEMPDIYHSVNMTTGDYPWDFTKYPADVVTICLGQNDGVQDSVKFCSAYVSFIANIRSKYPQAQIICLTSPMADNYLFNALENYLSGIVAYCHEQGDVKVHKLSLSYNMNSGCDAHPSMEEHQQVANELEPFIKQLMNW